MMRAFDSETGKILWETELPAGGFATPMTYEANGKQYVVIAAAGGKNGSKANDEFIAFSL
jgi:quinoprotein glucose dehydrogenase